MWKEPDEVIARVNRRVRGWIGCFHYANSARVFDKMQWQMRERVRRWLWNKHAKTQAHYADAYPNERPHDHYGLVNFLMQTEWKTHEANRRTALREPDAGNPHVRFDEGESLRSLAFEPLIPSGSPNYT